MFGMSDDKGNQGNTNQHNNQRNKKQSTVQILGNLVLIGQLGLSVIMPLLLCFFICYLLVSRLGAGQWVYIIGFILGLGASFMTAYKVYLHEINKQKPDEGDYNSNKHY